MSAKPYSILVINPGSTSTKLAVYHDASLVTEETVRHEVSAFAGCKTVFEQKDVRIHYLNEFLASKGMDPKSFDAFVGRGGLISPLDSGTYEISEKMYHDLTTGAAAVHASCLGGIIAYEMGKTYHIPAFVVDPVVVDEMEPLSKLTGIPGIERKSVFHALNTKAVARLCAEKLGKVYADCRFVIAHMGGGITVGAHRYGRVIDVNDGVSGEGPFTPERCGTVPVAPVIELCFSGKYSKEELLKLCVGQGGITAYLGTNDLREVEKLIRKGDDYAALVMDSMAYQVAKEIGAMSAVLDGTVDAIILTGGLAHSTRFTGAVKQKVYRLAQVMVYPGEHEMEALALGALRVLRGEEKIAAY